jgi:hypothetical protein
MYNISLFGIVTMNSLLVQQIHPKKKKKIESLPSAVTEPWFWNADLPHR